MNEFPLLPSDKYIAGLLGLTDEQYRYYMSEVRRRAAQGPQPSVVATVGVDFFLYLAAITQLLSIGFTIAASFFKPRGTGTLTPVQVRGETITNIQRYSPRTGFDGVQDTASLGAPIPLVYAKEETIDGVKYGGVRVNAMLIWSEMQVRQRSQFLRALFLIGEGDTSFNIDAARVAFGNNPMSPYRYSSTSVMDSTAYAKYTLYFKRNGGRITSADRVLGNTQDPSVTNANDVFLAPNPTGTRTTDFCQTYKPNSNTQFGLFAPLPNYVGYRINPNLRPGVTAQITVDAGGGKKTNPQGRIVCDRDNVALAQREKFTAKFSGRSGLIISGGPPPVVLTPSILDPPSGFPQDDFNDYMNSLPNEYDYYNLYVWMPYSAIFQRFSTCTTQYRGTYRLNSYGEARRYINPRLAYLSAVYSQPPSGCPEDSPAKVFSYTIYHPNETPLWGTGDAWTNSIANYRDGDAPLWVLVPDGVTPTFTTSGSLAVIPTANVIPTGENDSLQSNGVYAFTYEDQLGNQRVFTTAGVKPQIQPVSSFGGVAGGSYAMYTMCDFVSYAYAQYDVTVTQCDGSTSTTLEEARGPCNTLPRWTFVSKQLTNIC